jgi:hypothetical protein
MKERRLIKHRSLSSKELQVHTPKGVSSFLKFQETDVLYEGISGSSLN